MTLFTYRARDPHGILVTGQVEGPAKELIRTMLAEQGLIPIAVGVSRGIQTWFPKSNFFNKVRPEERVLFTRQFYTLFKAGMSMEALLATLVRQTPNRFLREALLRIQTDISQGSTLAKAFAKHPRIFNELYVNMLAAGEEAGILEEVLKNLAELLDRELEIQAGIQSAILYPKIVVGVLATAIGAMLAWVVPKFAQFYEHYQAPLPLPTLILIGLSHALRSYAWLAGLLGAGGFIALHRYYRTPAGRLRIDRLLWKIPVFGTLGQKIANAQFAHLLSTLYRSGIPITKGLSLLEGVIQHAVMSKDILTIRTRIERGQSLAEAMQETTSLAPMLIDATAVGEKTGALDKMLKGLGEHYDMEIQHITKNLSTLLEPILLIVIFGMVAFFALAIFLPIWNISRAVVH